VNALRSVMLSVLPKLPLRDQVRRLLRHALQAVTDLPSWTDRDHDTARGPAGRARSRPGRSSGAESP